MSCFTVTRYPIPRSILAAWARGEDIIVSQPKLPLLKASCLKRKRLVLSDGSGSEDPESEVEFVSDGVAKSKSKKIFTSSETAGLSSRRKRIFTGLLFRFSVFYIEQY